MLWFWHGHFTTGAAKVKLAPLLFRQHQLLAYHALGNFRQMLLAVTVDAAMLLYLDGHASLGNNPNENYAHGLLELFTLGSEGNNFERGDVKAAARALAGWYAAGYPEEYGPYKPDEIVAVFDQASASPGEVTFLRQTDHFDVTSLVDRILAQPACAEWIARKLFRHFIHPEPDRRSVTDLAAVFRANNYEIRPLLSALFRHPDFLSARARGSRARLPLELLLAAAAAFSVRSDFFDHDTFLRETGGVPFDPPDTLGWPLDGRWLGRAHALARAELGALAFKLPDSNAAVKAVAAANNPVEAALRQTSLYEPSLSTRAGMVQLSASLGEPRLRARALLALAVASPEFALI
jgi:uncharacterized protein (DUF1800 family)